MDEEIETDTHRELRYHKEQQKAEEEREPSQIEDVPDDDEVVETAAPSAEWLAAHKAAIHGLEDTLESMRKTAEGVPPEPSPEPTNFEYIIDLGDMPASGDERMDIALAVLRALDDSLDELTGDLNPAKIKKYVEQMQRMLSDGITLYNIMRGRWAIEKEYKVGDIVYFDYYSVSHMGEIETIGKNKVLIKFKHRHKDRPNDEPKEIHTWRRRDQIKKP